MDVGLDDLTPEIMEDLDVVVNGKRFISAEKLERERAYLQERESFWFSQTAQLDNTVRGLTDAVQIAANDRDAATGRANTAEYQLHQVRDLVNDLTYEPETIELVDDTGASRGFIPSVHRDPDVPFVIGPTGAVEISQEEAEQDHEWKEFTEQADAYIKTVIKKSKRKPFFSRWLTGLWIGIIGVIVGTAAVAYSPDKPTVVDTVQIISPGPVEAGVEQNLTWAPVSGVEGYYVEIFRGGFLVKHTKTVEPNVEVELISGSYQWLVYPLRGGVEGKAIVNTLLTVV